MRYLLTFLMLSSVTACTEEIPQSPSDHKSKSQDCFEVIKQTIDSLKAKGPGHEGASLNDYFVKDLDGDGVFEIIERSNRIEAAYMGYLNTEIYPAFEYDKIFVLKDGAYIGSETDVAFYLENRLAHYNFWRISIQNPVNLSSDSQNIIAESDSSFVSEIDWIIEGIEKKLKK